MFDCKTVGISWMVPKNELTALPPLPRTPRPKHLPGAPQMQKELGCWVKEQQFLRKSGRGSFPWDVVVVGPEDAAGGSRWPTCLPAMAKLIPGTHTCTWANKKDPNTKTSTAESCLSLLCPPRVAQLDLKSPWTISRTDHPTVFVGFYF